MKKLKTIHLQSAMPAGADPRERIRVLSQVWETSFSGGISTVAPRPIISDSWERVRRLGIDPERHREPRAAGLEEVEHQRECSGLAPVLDVLRAGLTAIADDGVHIMVVAGADGGILWREGSHGVLLKAEDMGFVEGARWGEDTVGTNGIGTGLATERPVQILAAEHFVRSHHPWVCTSAPVYDMFEGRLLGVADVSGPATTVHPSTLALVNSVCELAHDTLRQAKYDALTHLRCLAGPVLAGLRGPAIVVDRHGWVAAAKDIWAGEQILLPDRFDGEAQHIPSIGWCRVEPMFDGWLVRVNPSEPDRPTVVRLDLRERTAHIELEAPSGSWRYRLTPRHAEILLILMQSADGCTAAQLSQGLFGERTHTVTVRAEIARLRKRLGSLIEPCPYRFPAWLTVEYLLPADPAMLLPQSTGPAVRMLRAGNSTGS